MRTLLQTSPLLLVAHYQPEGVRPTDPPSPNFGLPRFLFSSLEDAMLKALPSLVQNLLGTSSSARVEFYDKFQPEADGYD